MIIYRYFSRAIIITLLTVTGFLLLIFMSNQLIHYLSRVVSGGLSASLVLDLMAIQIPYLLGYLLPLGLYLALLLVYGRFQADSEMVVWHACGLSTKQWVGFTQLLALAVMVVVGVLTLWLSPHMMTVRDRLRHQTQSDIMLQTLMPGRFQTVPGGQGVLYVERLSRDRTHTGRVFLAQPSGHKLGSWTVVSAQSAYQTTNKATGEPFMVLKDGQRYSGVPGEYKFSETRFHRYGMKLDQGPTFFKRHHVAFSTKELWHRASGDLHAMAELQWRLSVPFTVPILALLAIALSQVPPRFGRYSQLFPAILIFIVYLNGLFVARNSLEMGTLSPWWGLWWLHALLLGLALCLLQKRQIKRFFSRWRTTKVPKAC
ncbi:MAG: LPS export ABC transporter permease LptF [Gammaproteobacteria bacterium]